MHHRDGMKPVPMTTRSKAMRHERSSWAFAAIVGVLLIAGPAFAEDVPSPKRDRAEFCKQNPERCEQMKQRRAEREEFCNQNPQKCEEQRARMKQRRAEFKAKCEADPAWCEQKKQERRERFHERHGMEPANEGAPQPPE